MLSLKEVKEDTNNLCILNLVISNVFLNQHAKKDK